MHLLRPSTNSVHRQQSEYTTTPHFIPYVQLHEFEAFIMVDPDKLLVMYPDAQAQINRLKRDILNKRPEEINESPHTAPSKRIIHYLPDYERQKSQVGPMIAEDIGLALLRQSCPHFDEWLTKLENWKIGKLENGKRVQLHFVPQDLLNC